MRSLSDSDAEENGVVVVESRGSVYSRKEGRMQWYVRLGAAE